MFIIFKGNIQNHENQLRIITALVFFSIRKIKIFAIFSLAAIDVSSRNGAKKMSEKNETDTISNREKIHSAYVSHTNYRLIWLKAIESPLTSNIYYRSLVTWTSAMVLFCHIETAIFCVGSFFRWFLAFARYLFP